MKRNSRSLAALAALAASAALLAGCSSSDGGNNAKQKEYPLSGFQTYETAREITDDLAAGGLPCEGYREADGQRWPTSSGKCAITAYEKEQELWLRVFLSEENLDLQAKNLNTLGQIRGTYGYLKGKNWIVECGNPSFCSKVKDVLGGEVHAKTGPRLTFYPGGR